MRHSFLMKHFLNIRFPFHSIPFQAALHDSVIVEDLQSAEQLAYIEAPRLNLKVKVVTLTGEKVLKNGNISLDVSVSVVGGVI